MIKHICAFVHIHLLNNLIFCQVYFQHLHWQWAERCPKPKSFSEVYEATFSYVVPSEDQMQFPELEGVTELGYLFHV